MSSDTAEHRRLTEGAAASAGQVHYRKLTNWATLSLVFGVLSLLTAFDWVLAVLPILGLYLGFGALQRIDRSPREFTGVGVAKAGMLLSAVFWVAGYGWLTYLHFADVPSGYHGITFDTLQPPPDDKTGEPPPSAKELDGKRIFIKGYMYPGRQTSGITKFVLVPTVSHCQYCMPKIKPTEVIEVELIHGIKARYTTRIRGVGGEFHIRSPEDKEPGMLYQIRADYLR